jgi:hypothetical protein
VGHHPCTILKRDKHICQNCLRGGRVDLQRRLTTSRQRHTAVLMMTQTSKASAGPATAPKQGANVSNDTDYHYSEMIANATICTQMISISFRRGDQISVARPKDRRLSRFFIPAKNEI